VELSKEMSFYDITLEGDTLQIVNAIKAGRKKIGANLVI
jgi:hypothetical protein